MQTFKHRSERGSILIVALILSAVIGISLVSYMQLGRSSLTISNRALYNNAAINLAENGLEEAMYSINKMVADSSYPWTNWTNNGTAGDSAAWRKWTDVEFDQNARGMVRVYVEKYKGIVAPKIIARASITLGGATSAPIEKWIEVTTRKTSKFANGLVAKTSVVFNGAQSKVDSWNSAAVAGTYTPFSDAVRKDNGSVGSISVGVDAVLIKQADIWGFVSTGGSDPTTTVGTGGSVLGAASTYDAATWSSTNVDPNRVSTDFAASFDPVTAPAKTYLDAGTIDNDTVLPYPADVAAGKADADGNYYYTATKVDIGNNEYLRVNGKVVLRLTNAADTVTVNIGGGNGELTIQAGGSLAIYTEGDIKIAGQGVANGTDANGNGKIDVSEAAAPVNFQLWGTRTTPSQNFALRGNGAYSGVLYAPQGKVEVSGTSAALGSIVANTITMSGDVEFHYDESLGNYGGGNPFRVSKWKELTTAADRNDYAGVLSW